jgi:hypothetical protein
MLGRACSFFSASRKETFVAPHAPIVDLTNAIGSLNTMEGPVTTLDDLLTITPELGRRAKERSPLPDPDETFVNRDSDAESDIEVVRVSQHHRSNPRHADQTHRNSAETAPTPSARSPAILPMRPNS